MVMNQPFTTTTPVIATFDFTELASGTGIITLSAYSSETSGGLDYHLTSDTTQFSSTIETLVNQDAATVTIDEDYDLPEFNESITLNGVATVSFTLVIKADAAAGSTGVATVTIRKFDGTTETDLVSVTSPTIPNPSSTATTKELMVIPLTIPKTVFQKGDTLRLTIVAVGTRAGSLSHRIYLGHDPRNRDSSDAGGIVPSTDDPDTISSTIFKVPFDIDR